jgi:hypothetical protein
MNQEEKLIEFARIVADCPPEGLTVLPLAAQALLSELGIPRADTSRVAGERSGEE